MHPNLTLLATIMNAWVAIVEPILSSNSEKIATQSNSDLPARISSLIRYVNYECPSAVQIS
jgi:hypothetical protein